MAKTKLPLFSLTASGSVAGLLTFSQRNTGQQVRYQRKQKDRYTNSRALQRWRYMEAVNSWNNLDEFEKNHLSMEARGLYMTGYNLHVKRYLELLKDRTPVAVFGVAFFGLSVYGQIE